jgi:hypothetical protein
MSTTPVFHHRSSLHLYRLAEHFYRIARGKQKDFLIHQRVLSSVSSGISLMLASSKKALTVRQALRRDPASVSQATKRRFRASKCKEPFSEMMSSRNFRTSV